MISLYLLILVVHQIPIKEIHVATAQRYAAAAFRDGLTETTIHDLASLACWGRHQQNTERDLHRWIPSAYDSKLSTHSTSLEIYNPDSAKIEQLEVPILLASDVLHSLWAKQNPKLWDVCIGTTAEKCKDFWQYAQQDWASDHPVIQSVGCINIYSVNMCFLFHPQSFDFLIGLHIMNSPATWRA